MSEPRPVQVDQTDHLFRRNPSAPLPTVVRGEGVFLYDESGKRYLDGSGGALVAGIGHGVREVADAVAQQMAQVSYAHGTQFTVPAQTALAARLADLTPGDLSRVYLVSGGSEATESAIKLSRQYQVAAGRAEKHLVISRWLSYHGSTLGALSMTGHHYRRRPYRPLLIDFPHIPPSYCYRCPFDLTYPSCGIRCATILEDTIRQTGPEYVAAFIAEPIVGAAAGAIVPPPEYFPIIRAICDRYDVLLIADEVMTGIGRTGRNFAIDHWQVVPDLITTGKGVSGGYAPLGALIARESIFETISGTASGFVHGHTYGGHPPSAAAGAAVLKYLTDHDLVEAAERQGEYLFDRLRRLAERPTVGDVRGKGLMAGIEFVRDKATKEPFPRAAGYAERLGRG
ncbi:MAG TPA: aminotransferase class III-fold pyridoxal phosphate-dependent enzyme, partial [Dehalococcoidia bacterium]|nr:aminotransferase class III-fold pyridoxal phosphate-dependent enzyme [Dehalococcoidia bacterium]